ncbi:MAG TPA: translation elongation factor Ts [Candidatus Binatia bacterium]|jgi:elongation factor Ts
MNIDAKLVKDLRERTGAGMMDCKKALADTAGDIEKAVAVLREKGLAGASKKAGRVAADGLVGVLSSPDSKSAVVFELNCETDFVAKTDAFRALLQTLGAALLAADVTEGSGDTVSGLKVEGGKTIAALLTESIAQIGENIGLRRFSRFASKNGVVGSYVHAGGKIGVLVEIAGGDSRHIELARSLAMQVAAAFPRCVSRDEIAAGDLAAEREIYRQQALSSGKPEKIVDRIVDGKIEKFYSEICLLEQEYVRDSDLRVDKLVAQSAKETGASLSVSRFARFQLGEGIEKKQSNLADEVAQTIGQSA